MEKCIQPDTKAFLFDLVDLNALIGPKELEQKCQSKMEEGQECRLDPELFDRNLQELALKIAEIPVCGES